MTELDHAPAEATAERADQPPAGEQRPGSGDQTRYPSGVTAADANPSYYDGDIKAALAADTTPTRQQAARDDASNHQAPGDTTTESHDAPASGHDPDIEAILHENDNLPEPRTRQEAARSDPDRQATDATTTESHDPLVTSHDPDIEAILHESDYLPEPRTRQEAARSDQPERPGPDPLGDATGKDGPAARRPSGEFRPDHGGERVDVAASYPADYVPSDIPAPNIDGPHQAPEPWIDGINPEREKPGRNNNCGECSRAVDSTWGGEPRVAAALADRDAGGEPIGRMTEWTDTPPVNASMAEVGQRLTELGHGSSAVVGCDWKLGGGHWFNAVNYDGKVMAVDGQSGRIENWPPSANGLGFDENSMRWSDAIFFTADRKVVSE
jgi:Papain fold toxin 1, glutamine deamidase